jgi:hypothetical protein
MSSVQLGRALWLLLPSAALLLGIVARRLWRRPTPLVVDVTTAVAGAGLGAGALLVQPSVEAIAWWLTPPLMAFLTVAHVRALFAGDGPLRT